MLWTGSTPGRLTVALDDLRKVLDPVFVLSHSDIGCCRERPAELIFAGWCFGQCPRDASVLATANCDPRSAERPCALDLIVDGQRRARSRFDRNIWLPDGRIRTARRRWRRNRNGGLRSGPTHSRVLTRSGDDFRNRLVFNDDAAAINNSDRRLGPVSEGEGRRCRADTDNGKKRSVAKDRVAEHNTAQRTQ